MLSVLCGPFHPSLEKAFVERLRELKKGDPLAQICVVAPSARLANRLKELSLQAFPKGIGALHVHHLMSFARTVAGVTQIADNELVLERLVAEIIAKDFPKGRYLSAVAENPKLARAILGVLNELREGAVDADQAYEAFKEGHLGEKTDLKFPEILALHKAYGDELERRGWTDRAALIRLATERAAESPYLAPFKEILYYGFYELVQVQADLFAAVSSTHSTRLFFPLEKDHEGYKFAGEFFDQMIVGRAKEHRFLPANRPRKPAGVHASGARDEVWACAKRILKWRRDGVPFESMGVVARTLEPYAIHVEAIFRENDIPFTSSARLSREREPFIAAVRSIVTLARDEFPRDGMMDLLASPSFRHDGTPDPILWDAMTRAKGIGQGADEWRRRLPPDAEFIHHRGERGDQEVFRVPKSQVALFRSGVERVLRAVAPPKKGLAKWLQAAIDDLLVPGEGIADALDRFAESGVDDLDALLRCVTDLKTPAGAENIRGVQVLDAMSARGLPFRCLSILGLNERVFPRYILEEAFLRDKIRAQVGTRLGSRLPQKLRGYDEERLLFTLLVASAGDELVLSWQRSDEKGRVKIPSAFVPKELVSLEAVPRSPGERLESVDPIFLTRKEAMLRDALASKSAKRLSVASGLFGWEPMDRQAAFLKEIDTARTAGVNDGIVGVKGRGSMISPTALESYGTCPFQYFAQRVLRLEALESPELERELHPMDEGKLYHRILEEHFGGRTLTQAMSKVFREFEEGQSIRHPLLWDVTQSAMRTVLEAVIADDLEKRDGFVPSQFELKVDHELSIGGAKVRVLGYIDRLDTRPDGAFRVIDYKLSRSARYSTSIEKGMERGRYFQPPLYFYLAEQLLKAKGPVLRGASRSGYYFLRQMAEGSSKGTLWLDGDFDEKPFGEAFARVLGGIDRGEFQIRVAEHCTYCDYAVLCRKRHLPTQVRARRLEENHGA